MGMEFSLLGAPQEIILLAGLLSLCGVHPHAMIPAMIADERCRGELHDHQTILNVDWPAANALQAQPRRERMPTSPVRAPSPPTKISSPSGKTPTPTSLSCGKLAEYAKLQ
jgi:hypothetical protein